MRRRLTIAIALLAGCNDFPTPAEVDHAQIIAMRADPPAVAAGGRTRLSALVVDAAGPVTAPPAWSVIGLVPEAPPVGSIEVDGEGAWFVAPDRVGEPTLAGVQVVVQHPERTLIGVKAIGVGFASSANPEVTELLVDGAAVAPEQTIALPAGGRAGLSVEMAPEPGEDGGVAWYATVGEIEPYRQPVTAIAAPDDPADGWLFVVVRDGRGGIGWRSARLLVQ